MGVISGILGHTSQVNVEEVEKEVSFLLIENEAVEDAFKLVRDLFIFTSKRLILVDKQGVTGKKTEHYSIPYKSISHFSIESAGHFDLDSELKIWIKGNSTPIKKDFKKNSNLDQVQKTLAAYVLGK